MPVERTEDKKVSGRKGPFRLVVRIVTGLVLATLVIVVIAWAWIVPDVIRRKVEWGLSSYCEGPVKIGTVQAHYSGQVSLGGILFYDKAKRAWLSVERAKAVLANWPSLNPTVGELTIDGLDLRLSAAAGAGFKIPARLGKRKAPDSAGRPLSLRKLVVRDAVISVEDPNAPKVALGGLWLDATRQTDVYNILLSRRAADDSNTVSVKGTVNATSLQVRLSLSADRVVNEQEAAVAFAAMGMPHYSAKGKVLVDVAIAGDLNQPSGWEATGRIECNEGTVFFKNAVLADKLIATAKLDGRHLGIEDYQAAMCKGKVSGSFHADVNENERIEFRGHVLAVNVNFPEFISVLTAEARKAAGGTFTASYNFAGQHSGTRTLNGEGLIFFDDADVSVLPLIPHIFAAVGLSQYEPLRTSDAEAAFKTSGSIATLQSGHIANNFAAIEFEPGGTIDLQAKQIDGYVVAAPLGQLAGAIESLPIVKILARIKDKLMRLHVKGDWSDPPGKLITKEPVKDLKESTVGFFQDVVKGGGQFGRGIVDRLGGLFKTGEKKSQ